MSCEEIHLNKIILHTLETEKIVTQIYFYFIIRVNRLSLITVPFRFLAFLAATYNEN